MTRRTLWLVPVLALALLSAGALWPSSNEEDGTDEPLVAWILPPGVQAGVADALMTSIPFGLSAAELQEDRDEVLAKVAFSCTEGEQFRLQVTIDQGEATGTGETDGDCTGDVQVPEVQVAGEGPASFATGDADASGWVRTFEGEVAENNQTDEHRWDDEAVELAVAADVDGDDNTTTIVVVLVVAAVVVAVIAGAVVWLIRRRGAQA